MKRLAVIALGLVLTGCAGSPAAVAMLDAEGLQAEPLMSLCNAYGVNRSDKVKVELVRRQAVRSSMWPHVDAQSVRMGMTTCEMAAALGAPYTINRTQSAAGTQFQYVYKRCLGCDSRFYVYTANGVVTAIQD